MLLTITPNPALDRTLVVPQLVVGAVLRAERTLIAAGGKGLNVARAAHTLGLRVRVCAPLGGFTGAQIAQLAAAEGFDGRWSSIANETRTCSLLVDPTANRATAINEHGPLLSGAEWTAFTDCAYHATTGVALTTISGSLPLGIAPTALGTLVQCLSNCTRVIVDSSGAALAAALAVRPYGIKVNGEELGLVLGFPITTVAEAMRALVTLAQRGIALGVVTMGAEGAVAHDATGTYYARPPQLPGIVSAIGSGDSLLAGLAAGIIAGDPLSAALRLGVACGTADALTIGGGLSEIPTLERIQPAIEIVKLV